MTAFIRRFREVPSLATLTEIEQIALVDATPRTPVTGLGSGALMLVGQFEDGPFNEPTEVFGENDELSQFGGFGFTYGDLVHQNPSARLSLGEFWNGNGFLKGKFLRPPRKIIVRVDNSVGSVQFAPLASAQTAEGPYRLLVGDQLTVQVDGGGATTSTAVVANTASVTGGAFTGPGGNTTGFAGGEQISIAVDDSPAVTITFLAADQSPAQVAARINAALGYTAVTSDPTSVDIVGRVQGSSGSLTLADVTAGTLAIIGHVAATTASAGSNVANLASVTPAEIKVLFDPITDATAILVGNRVLLTSDTAGTGSIEINAGTMATALGIDSAQIGVQLEANEGPATSIGAGTRVQNVGGDEWVTMQTLSIPEGTTADPNLTSFDVKVRPALDNGTAALAASSTVNVLVDQPALRAFSVNNGAGLTAALTDAQLDVAYETAFDATLDVTKVSREATISLSARRSDAVIRKARANAIQASDEGNRGRVFHTRAALGVSPNTAIADVVSYRSDRVFYSYPGWTVRIPEIALVGTAGGQGFTGTGEITIGADGPLAYINSVLNPEENPGQDTGLLTFVTGIEAITADFNIALYIAFKRAGICAPRVDQRGTPIYQSEVTTDLTAGRTTQKRRKMADFIQDSLAILLLPFSKRLATDVREASIDAAFDSFLGNLQSVDQPELQRIADFSIANTTANNPTFAALGISARKVQVRMLSSLDTFLVDTEIGEGVVVTREA